MKKILFVINTLGGAGAETALIELLESLNPREYEISLFVLMGQGELVHRLPAHVRLLNRTYDDASVLSEEGKRRLTAKVLKLLCGRGSVFKNIPYMVANAWRMLRRGNLQVQKLLWKPMADGAWRSDEEYDLAVAYLEGGSAYYVANYVNAKIKAGFIHIDYEKAGYGPELDRGCYEEYQRIFTVSDEVREHFLNVYPDYRSKTEVFHNILNPDKICTKAQLPGGFDDEFTGIRLLTVGRLTAQKAYEVAVDAMKLLKDAGADVRWYVLGEGEERSRLEERIAGYGLQEDFLLLGAKENPYPYFAQTDIYVHATRFEGKSIAIQEAQVLGCALLVSDCSGNREQVTSGTDGLMCELSPEGIRDGVLSLMADEELRKTYGQEARKRILSEKNDLYKLLKLLGRE